ncbi:MAG: alpha/beta hydrolase fold domain-containing protein [Candidatus Heimdallarchaeota archaeon]|nr:alpha/beta hydrolase fold domain-containing protein [Candidatus Heimdallarchaeota archaeon]
MSLINFDSLREDVAKQIRKINRWQITSALKYLFLHPNFKVRPLKLMNQIYAENKYFFDKGTMSLEDDPYFSLKPHQRLYLTKLYRAAFDGMMQKLYKRSFILKLTQFNQVNAHGVTAEWQIPRKAIGKQVILYFHGGGYNIGSVKTYRGYTSLLAHKTRRKILSVDYRLAPEHQYPAALEDCLAAFRWLQKEGYSTENIIFAGDSAGGGLVLSSLLKLKQEEETMPNCGILFSPFTDWTFSGKSWFTNMPTDPIVCDLPLYRFGENYLNIEKVDLKNPLISPLFGDYEGLPPLLFLVSSTEMCYDDGKRVANRARATGVEIHWEEWQDMVHVFPAFGYKTDWPELKELYTKIQDFLAKQFG